MQVAPARSPPPAPLYPAALPSRPPFIADAAGTSHAGKIFFRPPSRLKTLVKPHVSTTCTATSPPAPVAFFPADNSPSRRHAIAELRASEDIGSTLSRVGGVLMVEDLNLVLKHFGESRRLDEVSQIFYWMKQHDQLNFASYGSFIKYMGVAGNHVKALEIYGSIPHESVRMHVSVCNSVLGCLVRNGKFGSSMQLFEQMKKDGFSPNLVTYNMLLSGCSKVKDGYSMAMHLVQELQSTGFQMDTVLYGTLISLCASSNLCDEAEVYFQKMLNEGCSPNIYHYSSLLNAYSLSGDYLKSEKLVNEMEASGVVPNKVILTTLLKVYTKRGLFDKARELLANLEDLGYAEDEIPYCLLMDNFSKAGHLQEAQKIFSHMRERGVPTERYAYSTMISAFCRCGLRNEAKQLAKEFEDSCGKYDLVMSNTLLMAYCNAGDMDCVMQVLRRMDDLKICPDQNTFHILIKYFFSQKLYHLAYRTIEDMHGKGHQLDEEVCSSVLVQLGKAGYPSEAFSIYNFLRYSRRNVSETLHEKILRILVSAGIMKDAYLVMKDNAKHISERSLVKFSNSFMKLGNIYWINDVLKAFHCSGHRIGQEIFRAACERYISNPMVKTRLLQMLQWMAGQGYVVDLDTRKLLLGNPHLLPQKHLVEEILSKQLIMSRKFTDKGKRRRTKNIFFCFVFWLCFTQ